MKRKANKSPSGESLEKRLTTLLHGENYRPLKQHQLANTLNLDTPERTQLRRILRDGERKGIFEKRRGNTWDIPRASARLEGRLHVTPKGFGFVIHEDADVEDTFIPPNAMNGALHMDRVEIERRPATRKGSSTEGRVTRIVERHFKRIPGLLMLQRKQWILIPDHPMLRNPWNVRGFDPAAGTPVAGMKALLIPDDDLRPESKLSGRISQILGPADQPGMDMISLLHERQIDVDFDAEAEAEADCPERLQAGFAEEDRVDARQEICFTIDPEDAKDHDDAVSILKMDSGNWRVGIHIADVSHYVRPGGAVDKQANERATSVYLVDRVIPMLPKRLTEDVCSLVPDQDRLAFSVWAEVSPYGEVVHAETAPSMIRSRARLHYEQVLEAIEGRPEAVPEEARQPIQELHRLSRILRKRRMDEGSIDFNLSEIRIVLNPETGRPLRIVKRDSNQAYQLIEEFMLLANQCVARQLNTAGYPTLYRVHPEPDEESWGKMTDDLMRLGVDLVPSCAHDLNRISAKYKEAPNVFAINLAMLRNLRQAYYAEARQIHFGLGFSHYLHFTSPIRRYPDLVVHRVLRALLRKKPAPYNKDTLNRMGIHCSDQERNAAAAEQESVQIKRLQYFEDQLAAGHTGPYRGVITRVKKHAASVELIDTLQSGWLPYRNFEDDRINADSENDSFYVTHSNKSYKVGDAIAVGISQIDPQEREAEFFPWEASGESRSKSPRKNSNRKTRPGKRIARKNSTREGKESTHKKRSGKRRR